MYTRNEDIAATEQALGVPLVCEMEYEITPGEFDMVKSSMHAGRAHDVTMFIRDGGNPDQIAVIRKPFFPEGAFRAPSGAAKPGESLEGVESVTITGWLFLRSDKPWQRWLIGGTWRCWFWRS